MDGSMGRMNRRSLSVCLLAVWLSALFTAGAASAEEHQVWSPGKLDLTGWDSRKDGTVPLSGPWDFYWMQLVDPSGPSGFPEGGRAPVPVPSRWGGLPWKDGYLSNQGYGTYRLQVVLPEAVSGQTMALSMRGVASAYKLWVNKELVGGNGTVGTDRQAMVPGELPQVVYFQAVPGANEVVVQVSNFVQRKGGIWEEPRLGTARSLTQERNRAILYEAFMIGCLAAIGLYHIGMYALRQKEKAALFFGGICVSITFRALVMDEVLGLYLLPGIPWETAVKVEYISAYVCCYCLIRLINAQYPTPTSSWTNKVSAVIHGAIALLVLVTDAAVYTRTMLFYQLAVIVPSLLYTFAVYVQAILHKKEGSWQQGIGFILFAATVTADILYYNQALETGNLLPLGLLLYLFFQAMSLSSRYARAFREAETLGLQLRAANETLEAKVRERTAALLDSHDRLEEANRELSRAEAFRLRLLSNISHELGTPLTSVKGYARAVMDGVITEDFPRYAGRIYDRALYLERMIDDLVVLTKLETRQLPFHCEEHEALPLLRSLFGKYAPELAESGWILEWNEEDGRTAGPAVLTVDAFRLEQVIANLLGNIQKYAAPGGRIRVQATAEADGEHDRSTARTGSVTVRVTDSGPGIPEADRPYIFDRFYRVRGSSGQPPVQGAGLGLAICKEIILTHNGEIGYTPAPDGGSIFWFRLPVRYRKSHTGAEGEKERHGQDLAG